MTACPLRQTLIDEMKHVFGSDQPRISHSLTVLDYAEQILAHEPGDVLIVAAAAILHDIGIHQAQKKHSSSAGKWQEIEGPPIARDILTKLGMPSELIKHICDIIANHHSAANIDTPEFRIIWDADWLVNLPGQSSGASREKLADLIANIFKTPTGRRLAEELFLSDRA